MNDKRYWTVYKKYRSFTFIIKKIWYKVLSSYENRIKTRHVTYLIIKKIVRSMIQNSLLLTMLIAIDNLKQFFTVKIDQQLSSTLILSGIGTAGIFLGLYCANITSIYTAKYANAPDSIGSLLENDVLTNTSINHISNYILFSVLLAFSNIIGYTYGLISIIVFLLFTIWLVISFGLLGNRRHRLSDTYGVADEVYRNIVQMVIKSTFKGRFSKDINFQAHYQKVCAKSIATLNDIAKYNIENATNHADAMTKFAIQNYDLLSMYWSKKSQIPFSSKWYRDKSEYAKWHFASDHQIQIAIKTGTTLQPKTIQDTYWFEDSILAVNSLILNTLVASKDWHNLYLFGTVKNYAQKGMQALAG